MILTPKFKNNRLVNDYPLANLTDLQLVELAIATDGNDYYGELYARYTDKVLGKCLLMIKNVDIAKDCTQDILVKALTKLHTFKGKSSFSTWLFQVTYTHCIDYIRRNKNIQQEELEENRYEELQDDSVEMDDIHDKVALEMKIAKIQSIMDELKDDEKSIMILKYKQNLSINELCESLELSPSAVKMKLMRTRDKIRERYFELNPAV